MPKYESIDWEAAACRDEGIDPEIFYRIEEERSTSAYPYINAVRSICGRCPIQKACLAYAFENEDYGVWGGLTSLERASIHSSEKHPTYLIRAIKSLAVYGISFREVKEIHEHSTNVRSMANQSANR